MNTETEAVVSLYTEAAEKIAALDDIKNFSEERPFALVPEGYSIEDLTSYAQYIDARADAPRRVEKRMKFVDVDSFLQYFQKFRVGHRPQVFNKLTNEGLKVMAVFDYDEPVNQESHGGTEPKWGHNIAYLSLAYSRDYAELRNKAGEWFSQADFAQFVEENAHLFVVPDSATMMELAQSLKGAMNVEWQSGVRLNNSSTQLKYIEQIDATTVYGDPLTVPDYLQLRLPMYEGFTTQDVKLAFRWRLNREKQVNFSFKLLTKVQERQAEDEVKQKITEITALPLFTVSSFNGLTPHNLD